MVRDRIGGQFDPHVVAALVEAADVVLAPPESSDVWTDAVSRTPDD